MPIMKTLTIGGTTYDLEGGVTSVNGQTGAVVLGAADVGAATEQDIADAIIQVLPVDSASGSIASFPDGYPAPLESLSVQITPVQSGSGTPAPDNVRPITGWSEAVVTRTGVNVWDEEWRNGYYNPSTGVYTAHPDFLANKNPIPVQPSTTYYFTGINGVRFELFAFDASGTFIQRITNNLVSGEITTTANTAYLAFNSYTAGAITTYTSGLGFNYPSSVTTYSPYTAQTVTIDLSGTRYGGTLDVLTGVLTVTHGMVDMGSLEWTHRSDIKSGLFASSISDRLLSASFTCICSMYPFSGTVENIGNVTTDKSLYAHASNAGKQIYAYDTAYSNATTFTTAVTGQTLVYPLATPLSVQLTASELETLLGQNNVWANCGDVAVSYRADIQKYIQKLMS